MPRLALPLLALALAASALPADDWPQWLGPKRDGVWREAPPGEKFPPGGPKVEWRAAVGIGYAGPAVAAGKVYVPDRALGKDVKNPDNPFDTKTAVDGMERVLCLDEGTGKELWRHEYPSKYRISYAAGPRCTPVVDGDRVYTLGAMGDLFCLNTADGKPVWSKNFVKDYAAPVPVWGFAAHPLLDGDKLICLAGGNPDKLVIAFDKKSGKELWASQSCEGDFGYCPPVIFEFGGKRQLVIWHTHAVVGLDPETGKRLWRVPFEIKAALTAPMPRNVGADGLFVTSFYNGSMVLKVGADTAAVVWKGKDTGEMPNRTQDLHSIMPTPWVDGDFIYGVCSYGQLRAIKAGSGERVWETMKATRGTGTPANVAASPDPAPSERWSNAFLVKLGDAGNRYLLFNERGDLILARLTPTGYEETDRAHVIAPTNNMARGRMVVWTHPAFANGRVLIRNDKELVRLNPSK